ncbi:nuclear cap-binding protein subunit 3-like [Melitaea cinxia]|uniref:nuclear cap-binding protein subunit 3-like n=1 Tax=Melitaea cinxia TaxID=113334 RepID=UPI001E274985|nr:nuclear cap-binding protein subunit 3-like [Melitaea cinxia]
MEQEREEGEMSDDTEMIVDDDEGPELVNDKSSLFYKADKKGVYVEKLNKVDATKLEERAKRFGLNLTGSKVVTPNQIDQLYSNFGIESGNERHFRFDTLHLNGVSGLMTKEIFEYLEDYKPVSLEWVDDDSCNVVCQDHISVALALLVHSREITNEDIKKMLLEKSSYHWREGLPHPKNDTIFMRFATNSDKKVINKIAERKLKEIYKSESMYNISKNPWGDLCRSWGVYDHQEIFQRKLPKSEDSLQESTEIIQIKNKKLAMRLGKRNYQVENDEDSSDSDVEWRKKSKTPRMRMHADDEESKQVKYNPINHYKVEENDTYAPLSIEVINSKTTFVPRETKLVSDKFKYKEKSVKGSHKNIQSRLGVKVQEKSYSSDESHSNEMDYNIMSRVQKVANSAKNSVWSRLETSTPKITSQSDLRQILTKKQKSDDLRDKLSKSKQCNLRIEIDNNYADE